MSRRAATLAALLLALSPRGGAAQQVSLAPKLGTAGVGGDVILSLAPKLALKGGVGFSLVDVDLHMGRQTYRVEPPPILLMGALDIRIAGPVRIMAGLLHRSDETAFSGDLDGAVEVGEGSYDAAGRLEGSLVSPPTSPFVGVGFGALRGKGFHLYLDVALALAGDPDVRLEATGPITDEPGFEADLELERRSILDDIDPWYRYWPVVNLGFRFGF